MSLSREETELNKTISHTFPEGGSSNCRNTNARVSISPWQVAWNEDTHGLDARVMQDDEARPQEEDVEEADKAEEERHADPILVADPELHDGDVQSVDDGARKGHAVAYEDLHLALVREVPAVLVALTRQVDGADEHDAGEGCEHAGELAYRESLDSHQGAEDQRPHGRRGRQDGDAPDRRVGQGGRGQVVGQEPEHAELEAEPGRLTQRQLLLCRIHQPAVLHQGRVSEVRQGRIARTSVSLHQRRLVVHEEALGHAAVAATAGPLPGSLVVMVVAVGRQRQRLVAPIHSIRARTSFLLTF